MNNEPSVVTVNTTQSSLSQVGTGKESWKADVSNNVVPSSQLSTSTSLDGQERKASLNKTPLKAPSAQASVLAPSIGSDNQSVVGTRFGGNKSNNNIATSTSTTNSSPATQPKINNNTINNSTSNGNNINSHQINEDASSTVRTSNDQQVSSSLQHPSFDFQNFVCINYLFLCSSICIESIILKSRVSCSDA